MPGLIEETPEAAAWVLREKSRYAKTKVFGQLKGAAIWSDHLGADGQIIVPLDPSELVADINENASILLKGHDPGFPLGLMISAKSFTSPTGSIFVAGILGFYHNESAIGFSALGLADDNLPVVLPRQLPEVTNDSWIEFCVDPREVEDAWVKQVVSDAPLRIEQRDSSHNAADTLHELIRIGVPYAALVWNPFVTSFSNEAGKASWAAVNRWLQKSLTKLSDLTNPIVEIISNHRSCQISFMLRGTDIRRHYAAHQALSEAATRAATMVEKMHSQKLAPRRLIYEFHPDSAVWYPSYALLSDGRLITDSMNLIAVEQLPSGLSLGLKVGPPLKPARHQRTTPPGS